MQLVQHFHKLARGKDGYQPHRGGKEEAQAKAILTAYGFEKAKFIVEFAAAEAKQTNFQMRTFGAVLQYMSDAVADYERRETHRNAEAMRRKQEQDYIDARLSALSQKQHRTLYEKVKEQILIDVPSLAAAGDTLEPLIRTEMARELDRQERKKK